MAIPYTFAPINKRDFILTPVKVFKQYKLTEEDLSTTGSGYMLVEGYHSNIITPIGTIRSQNDPRNIVDNSFKHVIWKSIDHNYYRHPYNIFATREHSNENYTTKFLNLTGSLLSMPYFDFGEAIKKKSIKIENQNENIYLIDDGYGNIIDPTLTKALPDEELIGYWGFNNSFRNFKYSSGYLDVAKVKYTSAYINHNNNISVGEGVVFRPGIEIDGKNTGMAVGFGMNYNGTYNDISDDLGPGFILTEDVKELDFDNYHDFTISFWFYGSDKDIDSALISKKGVKFNNTFDKIEGKILSQFENEATNIYPYDFTYNGDSEIITFSRSDGLKKVEITGSAEANKWNHVIVTRHKENGEYKITLFINGILINDEIDNTNFPINDHCLMFGSENLDYDNPYYGYLDEIRFYRYVKYDNGSLDIPFYEELTNKEHIYNTNVVGNAFYKSGDIVISSLLPKYKDTFKGSYNVTYKGTHTIYQYEILCRIGRGQFTMTTNPTARISPESDILIDDFNGDLLKPYFTSIGMYNDNGELMAIAKMGQPVQLRDDVSINVLVKFDT